MKRVIVNQENPDGIEVDLTAEEITAKETEDANYETEKTEIANAKQANEDLKASAKAKLVAGEALTEAEADVMIGG